MAEPVEIGAGQSWKFWRNRKRLFALFAVCLLVTIGCSSDADIPSDSPGSSDSSESLQSSVAVETTVQTSTSTTVVEQTAVETTVVEKPPSTTLKMQETRALPNAWENHPGTQVDSCKLRFIAGDMSGEGADQFLEQWNEAVREFNDRKLLVDIKEASDQEKVAVVLHFTSREPGDNLLMESTGTHVGFLNGEGPVHVAINSDEFAAYAGSDAESRKKLGRDLSFVAMFQILADATPDRIVAGGDFYLRANLAGGNLLPGGYYSGLFNNLEKFGKAGCGP